MQDMATQRRLGLSAAAVGLRLRLRSPEPTHAATEDAPVEAMALGHGRADRALAGPRQARGRAGGPHAPPRGADAAASIAKAVIRNEISAARPIHPRF